MIFGGQRSPKATALIIGAVIFLAAFIGLVYNHLDAWEVPSKTSKPDIPVDDVDTPIDGLDDKPKDETPKVDTPVVKVDEDEAARDFFIKQAQKSYIKVDSPKYRPFGAFGWDLPSKAKWTKPLGENLCIIDLDNRPFSEPHQLFGPNVMSWDNADEVHGLSLGVLNHWLYAKIHGYKYYYIEIETPEDRRASWKKPPIMSEILKKHDACLYLDSDAIFHHLDLPFEWLMNYWEIHPDTNSLALAADPDAKSNQDKFGKVYLNTGFIVAQNNEKTFEIMDAWEKCPEENGPHPDCVIFRTNGPGRPTDQGGFGTYTRYDFAEDIKELPCGEANGFPESKSGCNGKFIRHLWTGKKDWIKVNIGEQIPGKYLELFHKQYLEEKKDFYITEKQLMAGN